MMTAGMAAGLAVHDITAGLGGLADARQRIELRQQPYDRSARSGVCHERGGKSGDSGLDIEPFQLQRFLQQSAALRL